MKLNNTFPELDILINKIVDNYLIYCNKVYIVSFANDFV